MFRLTRVLLHHRFTDYCSHRWDGIGKTPQLSHSALELGVEPNGHDRVLLCHARLCDSRITTRQAQMRCSLWIKLMTAG